MQARYSPFLPTPLLALLSCAALLIACAGPSTHFDPPRPAEPVPEFIAVPAMAQLDESQSLYTLDFQKAWTDGVPVLGAITLPPQASVGEKLPLLVIAHGQGGSLGSSKQARLTWAARGFLAVTFDARGHGESINFEDPNGGFRGGMSWQDLLDVMVLPHLVQAALLKQTNGQLEVDFDRLFWSGVSMGARAGAMAALWSGQVPPPEVASNWSQAYGNFPEWKGVIMRNLWPDLAERGIPDQVDFSHPLVHNSQFGNLKEFDVNGSSVQGYQWNADIWKQVRRYIETNEATGLDDWLRTDPRFAGVYGSFLGRFSSCQVPILWHLAYDDAWGRIDRALLAVRACNQVAGTPAIINLSTGGHRTATNQEEEEWRDRLDLALLEFQAFGNTDAIESVAPGAKSFGDIPHVTCAVVPSTESATKGDLKWRRESFPTVDAFLRVEDPLVMYFHQGGVLTDQPPEAGVTLGQTSITWDQPGYSIQNYIEFSRGTNAPWGPQPGSSVNTNHVLHILESEPSIATAVPLEFTFDWPEDALLGPTSKARIWLNANATEFQVAVRLSTLAKDTQERRQIGHGFAAVTFPSENQGPSKVEIDLEPYLYELETNDPVWVEIWPVIVHNPVFAEGTDPLFRHLPRFGQNISLELVTAPNRVSGITLSRKLSR